MKFTRGSNGWFLDFGRWSGTGMRIAYMPKSYTVHRLRTLVHFMAFSRSRFGLWLRWSSQGDAVDGSHVMFEFTLGRNPDKKIWRIHF